MKKLEQCLVSTFKMTYSKNIWRFLKWCYPQVIQIRPFEYCNPWFCGSSWLEKPVEPSMPSVWRWHACSQSFRSLSSASISFFTWSITYVRSRKNINLRGLHQIQDYTFSYMLNGNCWGYQNKQNIANEKYAVNIARCIKIMHSTYAICILYRSKYYYIILYI